MEESIEATLNQKGQELQKALEELRKKEFEFAVSELRSTLPQQGRCVICTLKLPCKHFSSIEAMPALPSPTKPQFSLQQFSEGLDVSALNVTLPSIEQNNKSFTIRFRGRGTKFTSPSAPRHSSLPNTQKLKLLEKIEAYKEEKLRKEIESIQKIKEQQEKIKKEQEISELKRLKHLEKIKGKLGKYKEEAKLKEEQAKLEEQEQSMKKKKEEEKKQKYLEMQKKKLEEYYEKKRTLEKIDKERLDDLEEEVIKRGKKWESKKVYKNVLN